MAEKLSTFRIRLSPLDWRTGRDQPAAIVESMMREYSFRPDQAVELTIVCGRENMRILRGGGKAALEALVRAGNPTLGPLKIRLEHAPTFPESGRSWSLPGRPTSMPAEHKGVD